MSGATHARAPRRAPCQRLHSGAGGRHRQQKLLIAYNCNNCSPSTVHRTNITTWQRHPLGSTATLTFWTTGVAHGRVVRVFGEMLVNHPAGRAIVLNASPALASVLKSSPLFLLLSHPPRPRRSRPSHTCGCQCRTCIGTAQRVTRDMSEMRAALAAPCTSASCPQAPASPPAHQRETRAQFNAVAAASQRSAHHCRWH